MLYDLVEAGGLNQRYSNGRAEDAGLARSECERGDVLAINRMNSQDGKSVAGGV